MTRTISIRGRNIDERVAWAVGAVVAILTPIFWIPTLFLLSLATMSGSVLPAIAVAIGTFGLLTWMTAIRPGGRSARVWAVGLWFLLSQLVWLVVVAAIGWAFDGSRSWAPEIGVLGVAGFAAVAGALAPLAFVTGQRLLATLQRHGG